MITNGGESVNTLFNWKSKGAGFNSSERGNYNISSWFEAGKTIIGPALSRVGELHERYTGRVCVTIQIDNGAKFISKALDKRAYEQKVVLDFSRPGNPTDDAYIESF